MTFVEGWGLRCAEGLATMIATLGYIPFVRLDLSLLFSVDMRTPRPSAN